MGHSNGKITAPVSLHADVYPVLGLTKTGTYYDTGWVCGNSHGQINKWSKRKPIRYAQPGELTDAQFKGTYADNNQGIYYGLKVASEAGRLGQLHTASWEYLPPRPGTDWCRLTDFVGYDHNAVPTLNGMYTGGNPCYYNTERNFTVSITYNKSSNTTGVDIGDMLPENVAGIVADCPYSSPEAIIRRVCADNMPLSGAALRIKRSRLRLSSSSSMADKSLPAA